MKLDTAIELLDGRVRLEMSAGQHTEWDHRARVRVVIRDFGADGALLERAGAVCSHRLDNRPGGLLMVIWYFPGERPMWLPDGG